jgi:hypothetical protein
MFKGDSNIGMHMNINCHPQCQHVIKKQSGDSLSNTSNFLFISLNTLTKFLEILKESSPSNELGSAIYRLGRMALDLPTPLTFDFLNSKTLGISFNFLQFSKLYYSNFCDSWTSICHHLVAFIL